MKVLFSVSHVKKPVPLRSINDVTEKVVPIRHCGKFAEINALTTLCGRNIKIICTNNDGCTDNDDQTEWFVIE